MIDFNNATFKKMKKVDDAEYNEIVFPLLGETEKVIAVYRAMRDGVVFTNKRIISINIQGMTGKKKDFTSMPYSKIQVFSVESAGVIDIDSELEIWFSAIGNVRLEFTGKCDIAEISRAISNHI